MLDARNSYCAYELFGRVYLRSLNEGLLDTQSLNLGVRRGIKDDVATWVSYGFHNYGKRLIVIVVLGQVLK